MAFSRILRLALACLAAAASGLPVSAQDVPPPVPPSAAPSDPVADAFPELRTAKGQVFTHVKVMAVEPDGLRLQHDAGVSKVTFLELPEAIRKNYHYNKEAAEEFTRATDAANRDAIAASEKERLRVLRLEQMRKAGVDPSIDIEADGPVTVEQVKARWLVANAGRGLVFGDRNYAAREADIAEYRLAVQSGAFDREAEKVAMRHNFEWYLKEGRTGQAALAHKRLATLEDEDLRREQIASMERLAKSLDRAAQGASSALLTELAAIRQELERLRLQREDRP